MVWEEEDWVDEEAISRRGIEGYGCQLFLPWKSVKYDHFINRIDDPCQKKI